MKTIPLDVAEKCQKGFILIGQYVSPANEMSLAKGIPYTLDNKEILRALGRCLPIRLKYRGPRSQKYRYQRQATCLEKDATTVAIYPK